MLTSAPVYNDLSTRDRDRQTNRERQRQRQTDKQREAETETDGRTESTKTSYRDRGSVFIYSSIHTCAIQLPGPRRFTFSQQ